MTAILHANIANPHTVVGSPHANKASPHPVVATPHAIVATPHHSTQLRVLDLGFGMNIYPPSYHGLASDV